MAAFTPSALTVQSMGSMNLTIAHLDADIISGTNYWASGITDIRSIMVGSRSGIPITGTTGPISVEWTASNGTIHTLFDRTLSNTGLILWILSGGPAVLI